MLDYTFIVVWVDHNIVASRNMRVISDVKKAIEATFHKYRGRLPWFLGLREKREESKVTVHQAHYIETMLERFQRHQFKPSRSATDLNLKLQTPKDGNEEVDRKINTILFGSILLAKQTRSDIKFIDNILSRHMNAHTNKHWLYGKRLLRFLRG